MTKPILSQEYVCALFEYRDGELYWKHRPREEFKLNRAYLQWNNRYVGTKVGTYSKGYLAVSIHKVRYMVHRIIFLMHHGYTPQFIDHIDCNRKNNRIENLRPATGSDNQYNHRIRKDNTSGYKGVAWSKLHNKWVAYITHKKKRMHLGLFTDCEAAVMTTTIAREVLHGEFARHE